MRGSFDTSHNFREKLREEYDSIYQGLSSKFDRYSADDEPDQIVAQVIEDFYNIPATVVTADLVYEKERQKKYKIEIPDIPTYKIRFAIEEGTWIVLLRDFFRSAIKEEFNRLITLEELIWETDGYTTDDLGYYVLELLQIGEKWVEPTFRYWQKNHDYGKIKDFAIVIIAAYHQSSLKRAELMFEGGERLFNSKIDKLSKLTELKDTSTWFSRANDFLQILSRDDKSSEEESAYNVFIISLALLQKEIANHNSQKKLDSEEDDTNGSISWTTLDPYNPDNLEDYKENIIQKLYLQEEEDPFIAGSRLLENELKDNKFDKEKIDEISNRYHEIIKDIDNHEIYKLQEIIPKILIDLKKLDLEDKLTLSHTDKIDSLPVWDSLMDTITRVKRIGDPQIAEESLVKAIRSVYLTLLDMKQTPLNGITRIMDHLQSSTKLDDHKFQNLKSDIKRVVEDNNGLSHKEIDNALISVLVKGFLESDETNDD